MKKKFRSNLTIGLSDKDLDTDLNKRQSVKSNTRSITDFVIVNKKMSLATIIEINFSKEESKNLNFASEAVYDPIFEKYNSIKNFKFVGISISSDKSVGIETKLVKK